MQKLTNLSKEELIELIVREREALSGWQPIESAPRDGTAFLTADADGWMQVCIYSDWGCVVRHTDFMEVGGVHYWQPLPTPPMEIK